MLESLAKLLDDIARFPYRRCLAAGVVLALAAAAFFLLWHPGTPAKVTLTRGDAAEQEPARLKVQVAGAVVRPEVYEVVDGSRVGEAIERAGGLLPEADTATLNLAEKCRDGQKIYVPRAGEVQSDTAPGGTAAKVNLNTASQKQLEELPGIGPKLAGEIISFREKNNGFSSIDELKKVKGIGDSRFEDLRELVTI